MFTDVEKSENKEMRQPKENDVADSRMIGQSPAHRTRLLRWESNNVKMQTHPNSGKPTLHSGNHPLPFAIRGLELPNIINSSLSIYLIACLPSKLTEQLHILQITSFQEK